MKPRAIDLSAENISDKDLALLNKLLEERDTKENKDKPFRLKRTKVINKPTLNRPPYSVNGEQIDIENCSLVRAPNSDRYYLVGKFRGEGGLGKVKDIRFYFKKEGNVLKRYTTEQVAKNMKTTSKEAAEDEAAKAIDAGKLKNVTHFSEIDKEKGTRKDIIIMPEAPGVTSEKYLQTHLNIPLSERLKMIELYVAEIAKVHASGYFNTDLKPDNMHYDGNVLTLVDWNSVVKKDEYVPGTPTTGTPWFFSTVNYGDTLQQREAYALAGVILCLLSIYNSKTTIYENLKVLAPKMTALKDAQRTWQPKYEQICAVIVTDYKYDSVGMASMLTKVAVNLDQKPEHFNAIVAIITELERIANRNDSSRVDFNKEDEKDYKKLSDLIKAARELAEKEEYSKKISANPPKINIIMKPRMNVTNTNEVISTTVPEVKSTAVQPATNTNVKSKVDLEQLINNFPDATHWSVLVSKKLVMYCDDITNPATSKAIAGFILNIADDKNRNIDELVKHIKTIIKSVGQDVNYNRPHIFKALYEHIGEFEKELTPDEKKSLKKYRDPTKSKSAFMTAFYEEKPTESSEGSNKVNKENIENIPAITIDPPGKH